MLRLDILGISRAVGSRWCNYNLIRRNLTQSNILLQKTPIPNHLNGDDKIKAKKRKSHAPKTLEESSKLATLKSESIITKSKDQTSNSKSTQKLNPIDYINSGPNIPENWRKLPLSNWKKQKFALHEKFGGQRWNPQKRLSRQEMQSVKILKEKLPDLSTTELSQHFRTSPEAIRRILKSNWKPTLEEEDDIHDRWKKRGEKIKNIYKEKEVEKLPKVILSTGQSGTSVKYSKDGKHANNKPIKEFGAEKRIRALNKKNLRKITF